MNVHLKLLARLKDLLATEGHAYEEFFKDKTDDQIMYLLFRNFHGTADAGAGLRLTQVGLDMFSTIYKPYEIKLLTNHRFARHDFIYMGRMAKLPYYMENPPLPEGDARLIVFDGHMGVMLKLNDGSITGLRTMSKNWG